MQGSNYDQSVVSRSIYAQSVVQGRQAKKVDLCLKGQTKVNLKG